MDIEQMKDELAELRRKQFNKSALLSYNVEHGTDEQMREWGKKYLQATIDVMDAENRLQKAVTEASWS